MKEISFKTPPINHEKPYATSYDIWVDKIVLKLRAKYGEASVLRGSKYYTFIMKQNPKDEMNPYIEIQIKCSLSLIRLSYSLKAIPTSIDQFL